MTQGLRINLGSGQRKFPEPWINVDTNPKWTPDILASGDSMPMFPSGSAEIIVLHHVLEHFGCGEGRAMLQECHRILAPRGILLVFVPDLRALGRMWNREEISTQIYVTNLYGAYMDSEADRHRWGFDTVSLLHELLDVGKWTSVVPFNWREIPGADIARAEWILGMEAVK